MKSKKSTQLYKAILETGLVYGLATWLYVILIEITHPRWIYNPLAVWCPIRVDYFGEIGFIIFILSFFLLRLKYNKI